jgi:hypothetical protein
MTGQVKEDLVARLGELGLHVEDGRLGFRAYLLPRGQLLSQPRAFSYHDAEDQERTLELPAGTLAFTICQVPVVVHAEGPQRVELTSVNGGSEIRQGLDLDADTSASIFERRGDVVRLDVFFALGGERSRGRLFRFR